MKSENRKANNTYANFGKYFVKVCPDLKTFNVGDENCGIFWKDVQLEMQKDGKAVKFDKVETEWKQPDFMNYTLLTIHYLGEESADVRIEVYAKEVKFSVTLSKGCTANFKGSVTLENVDDCFAMDTNNTDNILRSSFGPTTSANDDAVFNRQSDRAVIFTEASPKLSFDWGRNLYTTNLQATEFSVYVKERVYQDRFEVHYKGVNKHNTFPNPPVGWMTWYAVRFDACEKVVLDNARFLKEKLGDYGANTVWVDWEWYHSNFFNHEASSEIGYFNPDKVRYPHGLKYVADEIEKIGLIPSLWIGTTHEPAKVPFIEKYPDTVLAKDMEWCGEYFFDLSNEDYRKKYLAKAMGQIKKWNYKALKWDCLPVTMLYADKYHEYMDKPELTSEQALREVVEIGRQTVGEDFYMLSCAGAADREVRFAIDKFDGARIGGDIFTWQEYIDSFVKRIMRFYAFHNTELYCDPDNVVLREEYNTYDQAVSRATSVSMLGLPFTMGDDLTKLSEDRIDIIKHCIPSLDAHPSDVREMTLNDSVFTINLAIAKKFENWNVVDVMNLNEYEIEITVEFEKLNIEQGEYLVYDYWNNEFVGIFDKSFKTNLRSCASKVFAVRKLTGKPQIVSTSRHISQGGYDLENVEYCEKCKKLCGKSKVVKDDKYVITAYDPFTQKIVTKEIIPETTGTVSWEIKF